MALGQHLLAKPGIACAASVLPLAAALIRAVPGRVRSLKHGRKALTSSSASTPAALTLGQLEASYPLYCKALRRLVQEGKSLESVQRTVCWDRLEKLHRCLPSQYRNPITHYTMLRRELLASGGVAGAPAPVGV